MQWHRKLVRWLLRQKPHPRVRVEHLQVVFYTRQGCHLCETAWKVLEHSRKSYPFGVTRIDVDTDPELTAQYGTLVPVVTVNGKVRFHGSVNEVLWNRLLEAEVLRAAARPEQK